MAHGPGRYPCKAMFVAVVLGLAIGLAAFLVNRVRPAVETAQPTAQPVKATGKCAACHRLGTSAIVYPCVRNRHAGAEGRSPVQTELTEKYHPLPQSESSLACQAACANTNTRFFTAAGAIYIPRRLHRRS